MTDITKLAELEERVAKLEKGEKKVKKVKDPNAPKKAPTAYNKFMTKTSAEIREEWTAEGKTFKQTEVMAEVGARWGLSDLNTKNKKVEA